MKTVRSFLPLDRYHFDFHRCAYSKGFAQFDSPQDASYYGTWANPTTLTIVSYCEGDVTESTADNAQEFCEELRKIDAWNQKHQSGPARIDPGFSEAMKAAFIDLGLSDLLH
jgi:hypothetical protein